MSQTRATLFAKASGVKKIKSVHQLYSVHLPAERQTFEKFSFKAVLMLPCDMTPLNASRGTLIQRVARIHSDATHFPSAR